MLSDLPTHDLNVWKEVVHRYRTVWVPIDQLVCFTPLHSGDEEADFPDFPISASADVADVANVANVADVTNIAAAVALAKAVAQADNDEPPIYDLNVWKRVTHRYRTEWVPINQDVCLTPLLSDYVVPENAWAVVAQQIAPIEPIAQIAPIAPITSQ